MKQPSQVVNSVSWQKKNNSYFRRHQYKDLAKIFDKLLITEEDNRGHALLR